jgi:hypothetical protein
LITIVPELHIGHREVASKLASTIPKLPVLSQRILVDAGGYDRARYLVKRMMGPELGLDVDFEFQVDIGLTLQDNTAIRALEHMSCSIRDTDDVHGLINGYMSFPPMLSARPETQMVDKPGDPILTFRGWPSVDTCAVFDSFALLLSNLTLSKGDCF